MSPLSATARFSLAVPLGLMAAVAVFAGVAAEGGARTAGAGPASIDRTLLLGRSVQGRPITAIERGDPNGRPVLVFGCVDGDETAGIAVVRLLADQPLPTGIDLWLVPDLNPDGVYAGTRTNADGVDLNRNFPWHWRPLPHGPSYSGPRVLSEPESRTAAALIRRLRPRVTIWFHQPLGLVDESGGRLAVEQRFARLAHLPLQRLPRYPGSAASWQNTTIAGTTAFVVELPAAAPSSTALHRYAEAVLGTGASSQ